MEYRKLVIKRGSTVILTAHSGALPYSTKWGSKLVVLKGLDGWYTPSAEITTEPKLFGMGSYITKTRLPEINVSFDVVMLLDKDASYVHTLRDNLIYALGNEDAKISATMEYYKTPTTATAYRTEGYDSGILVSIDSFDVKMDEIAEISFTVNMPNGLLNRAI